MARSGVAILGSSGLIDASVIEWASDLAVTEKISLPAAIAKVKPELTEVKIMLLLANFYGIPFVDISAFNLEFSPKNILDVAYMLQNKVLPLGRRQQRLQLAIVDPSNQELVAAISFKTGLACDLILVAETLLAQVFQSHEPFKMRAEVVWAGSAAAETSVTDLLNSGAEEQPIVKFVYKMIVEAVQLGASDVHFEPYEESYRVRYRIDGVLSEIATPPGMIKDKVAARIKVVARLDIAERRIPQDGRLRVAVAANHLIDLRVSTLPTAYGEKIVLRILERNAASLGIAALGLDRQQQQIVLATIQRPYGLVLVTGPTGSGKTLTLYSCLSLLNDSSRNISTAEDPIEIPVAGINQVAINEKIGLSFGVALRALLRQDPDVIRVGEIRDRDTAEMALKAAQTGHLVLATLHTNDAAAALTRLLSLGVSGYNVGEALLTVLAQRLVRRLCPECKSLAKFEPALLIRAGFSPAEVASGWQPYIPRGCYACHATGYRGRIGVFEVMPLTETLKRLIILNVSALEVADQARQEGVLSLQQSGLDKVRQGITSLAEIAAHINE